MEERTPCFFPKNEPIADRGAEMTNHRPTIASIVPEKARKEDNFINN
jgi:hypothetical protein